MLKDKKIELSKLSEYRKTIMGISIILIMFCHNTFYFESNLLNKAFSYLNRLCSCGVDIFFLLSGMGLYFSYSKDRNIKGFYIRRAKRIFPSYIFFLFFFPFFYMLILHIKVADYPYVYYFTRYSLSGFFLNGNYSSWFVSSICVLYLLFPLIYEFVNKVDLNRKITMFFPFVLIDFIAIVLSVTAKGSLLAVNKIFFTRISVFIMGSYIGKLLKEKRNIKISLHSSLLGMILLLLVIFFNYHFNSVNAITIARILYLPFVLFFLPLLIVFCEYIKMKTHFIKNILNVLGGMSLEVYLSHERVLEGINNLDKIIKGNDTLCSILNNGLAIIVSLLLAYIVSKIIPKILCKCSYSKK